MHSFSGIELIASIFEPLSLCSSVPFFTFIIIAVHVGTLGLVGLYLVLRLLLYQSGRALWHRDVGRRLQAGLLVLKRLIEAHRGVEGLRWLGSDRAHALGCQASSDTVGVDDAALGLRVSQVGLPDEWLLRLLGLLLGAQLLEVRHHVTD